MQIDDFKIKINLLHVLELRFIKIFKYFNFCLHLNNYLFQTCADIKLVFIKNGYFITFVCLSEYRHIFIYFFKNYA